MKRISSIAALTAATALFLSANVSAQVSKCSETLLTDVRGDGPFSAVLTDDGYTTIAEIAVANSALGGNPDGGFSALVDAVVAADLVGALDDPAAELSVFAPVDSAFEAIPGDILTGIIDEGALPSVLLYHVSAGLIDVRKVRRIVAYDTLVGQDIFLKRGRAYPTINNSEVNCNGILTDNGLVWPIDSVMLPQF